MHVDWKLFHIATDFSKPNLEKSSATKKCNVEPSIVKNFFYSIKTTTTSTLWIVGSSGVYSVSANKNWHVGVMVQVGARVKIVI